MPSPGGPPTVLHFRHFWVDIQDGSFHPQDFQEAHEPTCAIGLRDAPEGESRPILGCRDGYLRGFNVNAETDEGYEIESYVAIGPLRLGGGDTHDGVFAEMTLTTGEDSGPMQWWLYVGRTPQDALRSAPVAMGTVGAGRSPVVRPRRRGMCAYVMLGNGVQDRRWNFEAANATVMPGGPARV